MQNSKYVSHSPIDEHLKRAEPRTVSFPPFRGIGPPTHLLGVGRGNLTRADDVIVERRENKDAFEMSVLHQSGLRWWRGDNKDSEKDHLSAQMIDI